MPLYEYHCDVCGHRFETIRKFSDPPPECPECGGAVRKLQSAPAFQFKGTGWYITDYARKDQPAAGGDAGGSEAAAADSKTDAKADAKADGKADTSKPKSESKAATAGSGSDTPKASKSA
jgi:putative FmdB family regulatory protein